MTFFEELQWRGMLHTFTPGIEEQLEKEMSTAYVGIDPTAESLHIGHLVSIIILKHFQKYGHKPILLVGGATAMIGDPSGKSKERNLLNEEIILFNQKCIKDQLSNLLDFNPKLDNSAEIVNNIEWMKNFSFIDFIRDIGKHISINYMLSKESVKKRIEASDEGMSFTEFTYQLVQGYDFLHLYNSKNCKIQFGGSDQWGNITTGTEMIRKIESGEAFALTCPLITKADGTKFGKTESGNIWLDSTKTSPYEFYQFWLNSSDVDAEKWIKIFTFLSKEETEDLINKHKLAPHLRILQNKLAEEITCFIHGRDEYELAVKTSNVLFGSDINFINNLTEKELLHIFDGVPKFDFPLLEIKNEVNIVSFLAETKIFPSKNEARKTILNGGVSINKCKVKTIDEKITISDILNEKYILVQRGKTNYFLVETI